MVVSVGVNVAFPLAFVVERLRALPLIAVVALALHVLLAWLAVELADLDGLAVALALSTSFVLAALLVELRALSPASRGLAVGCGGDRRPLAPRLPPARARPRLARGGSSRARDLRRARRPRPPARAQDVVGIPTGASLAAAT